MTIGEGIYVYILCETTTTTKKKDKNKLQKKSDDEQTLNDMAMTA